MSKKRRIASDYDKTANTYNKRYSAIQQEKFKVLDGLNPRGTILDLGCGSGLLATHLNRKLVGCDLSFEMCKLASKANKLASGSDGLASAHEKVVCADIDYLPYKKACVDAIFSFTALQNLPNFSRVFKEVRRVLKRDGLFVCSVLNKVDIGALKTEAELAGFKTKSESSCGEDVQFVFC